MIRRGQKNALLAIAALYMILGMTYVIIQFSIASRSETSADYDIKLEKREKLRSGSDVHLLEDVGSWKRVTSDGEFVENSFYRLRSVHDGRWLGHASGGVYCAVPESTLGIIGGYGVGVYVIQSWSTLFLTVLANGRLAMDRTKAKATGLWEIRFMPGKGVARLWSSTRGCAVRISGDHVVCDAETGGEEEAAATASQWEMYVEPRKACRSLGVDEDWEWVSRACWGLTGASERDATEKIILFGTPKPLKSLTANTSDVHDPFCILNRTLFNWALINNVQPVVFSDDPLNEELVKEVNRLNGARGIGCNLDVIKDFEEQKKFGQPTYRGLFLRALQAYPNAQTFMYSNMDILFSHTMPDTVSGIKRYHNIVSKRNHSIGGWFAVGRRINVDIPLNWTIDTGREGVLEVSFKSFGVPFQTLSEDYFVMSRHMFDWENIPDFVVGGVAFDNWLTTKAVSRAHAGAASTVDATATLTAVHQNHGENSKASHRHPKSQYNKLLAKKNGGWALGHTTDAPLITVRRFGAEIVVVNIFSLLID